MRLLSLWLFLLCFSANGMQAPAPKILQSLPPEIHLLVVRELTNSKTLEEAITALRNLSQSKSRSFYAIINTPTIVQELILALASRFDANPLFVAASLHTFEALQWLTREITKDPLGAFKALALAISESNPAVLHSLLLAGASLKTPESLEYGLLDFSWKLVVEEFQKTGKISANNKKIFAMLTAAGATTKIVYGSTPLADAVEKELGMQGIRFHMQPTTSQRFF